MKTCTKCGVRKLLDEFNRDRTTKDGRSPWCGDCERAYSKAYYEANRERLLAEDRERRANRTEEQREADRAKARAYQDANRERIRAAHRRRYWENKGKPQPAYSRDRGKVTTDSSSQTRSNTGTDHVAEASVDDDPLAMLRNLAERLGH